MKNKNVSSYEIDSQNFILTINFKTNCLSILTGIIPMSIMLWFYSVKPAIDQTIRDMDSPEFIEGLTTAINDLGIVKFYAIGLLCLVMLLSVLIGLSWLVGFICLSVLKTIHFYLKK